MFFRRVFAKNQNDYGKEVFDDTSSDHQSPPSPPMKMQKRRASIEEKQSRGLSVLQLTPLWEHIIRTNSMPRSINLVDVFDEFFERLHDPEWQVRQHALRVLVDVLIVMGQQADYHIQNLIHPLVDNLGHIAPAVRKGALDALRVYVAQTAMPETVMLEIMNYGMDRPVKDPFSGRMTVAVMLALPALILPVLITPKRVYVVKAVMEALANKMVKITYQEIALKILLKLKDMVGPTEFTEHMPVNVKKDFDLLCKVYGLPKSPSYHDSTVDLHVPAHDPKKPWASRFVPKKDIQGNFPSSHAPMNATVPNMSSSLPPMNSSSTPLNPTDGSNYFGNNYDSTYPFERTRLSNNLGTPKRNASPRSGSGGILRSSSENSLSLDGNGNSSGSESGASTMSFQTLQTQNNTAANSVTAPLENRSGGCGGGNGNGCEKSLGNGNVGKVIMETEIKINPETAVMMRILEQNASTQTDESDDENSTSAKRIITDFSAPYPVTPMREKNRDNDNNYLRCNPDNALPKNGRRVRFGGEIVKMRTPDSDTVDQSDDNENEIVNRPLPALPLQKQNSTLSDNSSVSSDNSHVNEYIKQANVGFMNDPSSLNQFRSNIDHLKERKTTGTLTEPYNFSRTVPSNRPISAKSNSQTSGSRAVSAGRGKNVQTPIDGSYYENETRQISSGKVITQEPQPQPQSTIYTPSGAPRTLPSGKASNNQALSQSTSNHSSIEHPSSGRSSVAQVHGEAYREPEFARQPSMEKIKNVKQSSYHSKDEDPRQTSSGRSSNAQQSGYESEYPRQSSSSRPPKAQKAPSSTSYQSSTEGPRQQSPGRTQKLAQSTSHNSSAEASRPSSSGRGSSSVQPTAHYEPEVDNERSPSRSSKHQKPVQSLSYQSSTEGPRQQSPGRGSNSNQMVQQSAPYESEMSTDRSHGRASKHSIQSSFQSSDGLPPTSSARGSSSRQPTQPVAHYESEVRNESSSSRASKHHSSAEGPMPPSPHRGSSSRQLRQSTSHYESEDHNERPQSRASKHQQPVQSSFHSSAEASYPPSSGQIVSQGSSEYSRPKSSRPQIVHSPLSNSNGSQPNSKDSSPPSNAGRFNSKDSSPSSTDYSQELTIGIPDVETILPAHFTPPSIMIKKTMPYSNFHQNRPSTSPMVSPRIVTFPPTSSSSHSSKASPNKSAPTTPNVYLRSRTSSPDRTVMRRSVSSLSPRTIHREVTMMHNLQRSPMTSPGRSRRMSNASIEDHERQRMEGGTQTPSYYDRAPYTPKLDEITQTSCDFVKYNVIAQTSDARVSENVAVSGLLIEESSPDSAVLESPVVHHQIKSWEGLGIVDYRVLKDLRSGDFRLRSRGICGIEDALKSSDNLVLLQPYLDSLLRTLLSSERNPDVIEDQRRVLSNLISRLPLETLEDRITQIVTGLCRQGGAGSNLVAKNLMQRLPTAAIVLKLLSDDFLQVRSSKFRENALQMVIYALLTFPSTYFDVANCVERTAKAALDRKKRVRQAALDVLAVLGQISSPKIVTDVVSRVAEYPKDGLMLLAATKARLARKQLPLVAADGEVHYALKVPSSQNVGSVIMFGSDIEYICSGSGSVSPTSLKNRSFPMHSNNKLGQESGRVFEERRIADSMNRYASGSVGTPTRSSPWSRIPVKSNSGSDDDHGYVIGIAHTNLQKPLESSGRFYGKLQSRSFPDISDATKEKTPVRQLSDNQTMKLRQGKPPVASTKFPAVETNVKSNPNQSNKAPYSFAPNSKAKNQRLPQSSDGVISGSTGSLQAQSQLEIRPKTHPPNDIQQPSGSVSHTVKHKQNVDQSENVQRKNSGKSNGNELTIQPFTPTIGLVESDDARSEPPEVIKTQPTSAKSKKSEEISNKDFVENYVEDQTRRTSGKTNSHILSDNDNNPNSIGSTPMHLSKEPTSSEIASVRNEIAHIQSVIENVKKEMVQMQQKSASPLKEKLSRPQSATSENTVIYEKDNQPVRSKTSMDFVKDDDAMEKPSASKTNPTTPKSIIKPPAIPFLIREPSPMPDDVISDDHSSNPAGDVTEDTHYEDEEQQESAEVSQGLDEVDESPQPETYDPMTDSAATISKDEIDDDDATIDTENVDYQQVFSPAPEEVTISIQRTSSKYLTVKRQAPLKRGVKMTPVKNPMPNINQTSSVPAMIKGNPHKVNNSLFPLSLKRFERPKDAIHSCLEQLESSGWEEVMEGLKTFVRLIRHHPEYVDAHIHLLTLAISKHVKNLRSQVSRAACSASSEFFMTNAKSLDADAEELAAALLNRTADTNKFLRADALKALESMCDALPPTKVILILIFRGANHQNAAVRCTTARLLNQVVFRIGCDKVFNLQKDIRDRLIVTGANLLMEGSLETRNYTKDIFKQLSIHSHYQKLLLDVIPANVYRNIEKSLKSIL